MSNRLVTLSPSLTVYIVEALGSHMTESRRDHSTGPCHAKPIDARHLQYRDCSWTKFCSKHIASCAGLGGSWFRIVTTLARVRHLSVPSNLFPSLASAFLLSSCRLTGGQAGVVSTSTPQDQPHCHQLFRQRRLGRKQRPDGT